MIPNALAAVLPVLLFLTVLYLMDSFKLVPRRSVLAAVAYGGVCALAITLLHAWLPLERLSSDIVNRYVAPVTEETAKALLVAALILTHRVGFLVDALVAGFAIGTGFALVENVVYLSTIDAPLSLWLTRGVGTALLHGAATGIFGMSFKTLIDRRRPLALALGAPLAAAVAIHSGFNHTFLPPVIQAGVMLLLLPVLVLVVFDRSERATREWVGAGLDLDVELLQLVGSEHFIHTRFGQYLLELRTRFPGAVVADMFCLLRLDLELAAHAKGLLIARAAGISLAGDADLHGALAERDHLQRHIGRTGLLALEPLQVTTSRDRWHRHLLNRVRGLEG
jgi:RsiW-degrading membrane proteinase PrsW (M82 family)